VTIELDTLSYAYANRPAPALREVSLVFQPGQIALLAGSSGSGKTTLIRCVNGLIPHAYKQGTLQGAIRCFGESTLGMTLAQIAGRVATVMQDPEKQIVAARVSNDIAFGLENLALPRAEIRERIEQVAKQLAITQLLDRETHTLSGGERQRVVIAGVLAVRPQAVLLDEPLAALDPPSARTVLDLFRALALDGKAIVLVEHRVRDVLRVRPEQCVALNDGALAFRGDADAYAGWIGPVPTIQSLAPARQPNGPTLLAFEDVSFGYSEDQLNTRGVSFDVRQGDVIALLGPNGAGKSTLCRLAIGLIRPRSGRISINGRDTTADTTAQRVRTVGYAFQNPSMTLFANTLREELGFGPRNIGIDDATALGGIKDALRIVDLPDLDLSKSPFALSYGQQKRVSLASVLTMRPRVLLMDEPTAGLDETTAETLMRNLFAAPGRPDALVMITHDLRLARRFANRVIVLNDGQIVADGAPESILDDAAALKRGGLA
jgi:energy-coupling factor transport system ATP-binding protein